MGMTIRGLRGGGKNKLQVTATSNTINGVTFTVNSDGTVLVNGTADADAFFILSDATFLRDSPSGTYVLTGCPSGGSTLSYNLDVQSARGADIGNGILIEYTNLTYANVRIRVYSGTSCNNLLFKPMIRLASVSDATFAPYSNICPISGWSEVNVWVKPTYDPTANPTATIQLGQTVYGGTLDVTNGVLTVRPYYGSYNGEPLVGPWISSMDAYAPGATPTTGAQVVDLGGTPIEIPLTATQISLLAGQNALWADSGNVTVEYLSSGGTDPDLMKLAVAFMGRK